MDVRCLSTCLSTGCEADRLPPPHRLCEFPWQSGFMFGTALLTFQRAFTYFTFTTGG